MIYVNKADSAPLYQQLYTSIIEEITNGSPAKELCPSANPDAF